MPRLLNHFLWESCHFHQSVNEKSATKIHSVLNQEVQYRSAIHWADMLFANVTWGRVGKKLDPKNIPTPKTSPHGVSFHRSTFNKTHHLKQWKFRISIEISAIPFSSNNCWQTRNRPLPKPRLHGVPSSSQGR